MHLMIIQAHILYSEKVVKNQRPKIKIKWSKIKKNQLRALYIFSSVYFYFFDHGFWFV